jgi:hypothetical protein
MRRRLAAAGLWWAVMNAASSDWAASRLGVAIERVAEALLVEDEETQRIVPARELLRPRP